MAGPADNHGAFDFVISRLRRGTEPPPHVHTREDEFFYLLAGEMRFYVDGKVFSATAGECIFLPRRIPHAWLITSDEVNTIAVVTPAGYTHGLEKMGSPAERMELPDDADAITYATADLTET
jgi:quercetin dioxygenase-like cupin family protein